MTKWAQRVDIPLDPYTNRKAFRERVAERPKVKEAMKAEGLIQ